MHLREDMALVRLQISTLETSTGYDALNIGLYSYYKACRILNKLKLDKSVALKGKCVTHLGSPVSSSNVLSTTTESNSWTCKDSCLLNDLCKASEYDSSSSSNNCIHYSSQSEHRYTGDNTPNFTCYHRPFYIHPESQTNTFMTT